jgi:hypothetical protein
MGSNGGSPGDLRFFLYSARQDPDLGENFLQGDRIRGGATRRDSQTGGWACKLAGWQAALGSRKSIPTSTVLIFFLLIPSRSLPGPVFRGLPDILAADKKKS